VSNKTSFRDDDDDDDGDCQTFGTHIYTNSESIFEPWRRLTIFRPHTSSAQVSHNEHWSISAPIGNDCRPPACPLWAETLSAERRGVGPGRCLGGPSFWWWRERDSTGVCCSLQYVPPHHRKSPRFGRRSVAVSGTGQRGKCGFVCSVSSPNVTILWSAGFATFLLGVAASPFLLHLMEERGGSTFPFQIHLFSSPYFSFPFHSKTFPFLSFPHPFPSVLN